MYFKNSNYTKRDYEATNVIAAKGDKPHQGDWTAISQEAFEDLTENLTQLHMIANTRYFGYL